jgi:predicted RecB family nuclease
MINPNTKNINIVEPNIGEHRWVGERDEIIKLERERYEPVLGGITKPHPLPIFISIIN